MPKSNTRAANGSGSITQLKNGRWRGKYQIDNNIKYFRGRTKSEVRAKIQDYMVSVRLGEVSTVKVKFEKFCEMWMTTVKRAQLKDSSYDRLDRTLRLYVINEIGQEYVDVIRPQLLQALINKYSEEYSFSTVKKVFEAIRACLEYAVQMEVIYKNPMNIVVMPRRENCAKGIKEVVVPTEAEMSKLLEEGAKKHNNGSFVYTQSYVDFYKFLASTGMRAGEGLALRNKNIDLVKGEIVVKETVSEVTNRDGEGNKLKLIYTSPKTKRGNRIVYISDGTKELISGIQERNKQNGFDSERLICNNVGESPRIHDLERTLARMCENAGIRKFGLHALRHFFASRFLEKGGDVVSLSKHLGHSNPAITLSIYVHQTEEQARRFKESLNLLDL